jgi:hypothetical protein
MARGLHADRHSVAAHAFVMPLFGRFHAHRRQELVHLDAQRLGLLAEQWAVTRAMVQRHFVCNQFHPMSRTSKSWARAGAGDCSGSNRSCAV